MRRFHWPCRTNTDYLYLLAAWTPRGRSWWKWLVYYDRRAVLFWHRYRGCVRFGLPLVGCIEVHWQ